MIKYSIFFWIELGALAMLSCGAGMDAQASPGFVTGWGVNRAQQIDTPMELTNAAAVCAGYAHAVALCRDGNVRAWGDNTAGQTAVPTAATNVSAIAAGYRHSLALRNDGSVVGWGDNLLGQLTPPPGATSLVAIAAGGTHSLGLRPDGKVVAWGGNASGQTNVPASLSSVKAIAAGAFHSLALRSNGTVCAWGYGGNGETSVPFGLSNVVAIACGSHHNLALREDGTVVAWGFREQGQVDVPAGLSPAAAISAGLSHSLALLRDGSIVSWGQGGGMVPENMADVQQVAAGANFSVAIVPGPVLVRQPADTLIVPGRSLTLGALAVGGEALMPQWQKNGEDLPGETNESLTILNAQYGHAGDYRLRVFDNGKVVYSQIARLLAPPIIMSQPQSADVYYGNNVAFDASVSGTAPLTYQWHLNNRPVFNGTNRTLIITNASYDLSGNYYTVISNCAGTVTSSIATLTIHTKLDVTVQPLSDPIPYGGSFYLSAWISFGWPDSLQWQFNGQDIPGETSSALQVTNVRPSMTGRYRVAASTVAGVVYSPEVFITVGRMNPVNFAGRRTTIDLGTGFGLARGFRWLHDGVELPGQTNAMIVLDPLVPSDAGRYTAAMLFEDEEQMVDAAQLTVLPAPPVGHIVGWGHTNSLLSPPLSEIRDAVAVAVGYSHGVVVRADGRVFWWGTPDQSSAVWRNDLGAVVGISARGSGSAILGDTGKAISDTWTYCYPCEVMQTNRFVQIAFGGEYALGLRNDGTAVGWGIIGGGNPVPVGLQGLVAIAAGESHALALRNDGKVFAWGANGYGQTNVPAGLRDVVAIACGWDHSMALRSDGTVAVWGNNYSGQCNVPAGLINVVAIGAGTSQSYAIHSDGSVTAWGDNTFGQCDVPPGLAGAVAVTGGHSLSIALVGSTNNPAILEQPFGAARELGETAVFRVRAWSSIPIAYQWLRNGTDLPGATGPSLALTNLALSDEGDYSVRVTTSAGSAVSDPARLYVNPAPFLFLPEVRGAVVVWGGQEYSSGSPSAPPELGEVAAISAHPTALSSYAIDRNGVATIWERYSAFQLPGSNLVSVVKWHDAFLGLGANGLVRAWTAELEETSPPEGLRNVIQLAGNGAGYYIAVRQDGSIVHSFSANDVPTNLPKVVRAAAGLYHGVFLCQDGRVVLSRLAYATRQTPVPDGLANVIEIAAGAEHTLALTRDGNVVAWGRNLEGQCNVPVGTSNVIAIAAGRNFSMALLANGTIAVWGEGGNGQALLPPGLTNVAAIAAGSSQCLAVIRGPVLLSPPQDREVPPGETAVFEVLAEGAAPLFYQWSYRGQPLPGATNAALRVISGPQTEGVYSVRVSNNEGSVTADAVLWLGIPPEILVQPEGGTMSIGSSKTFRLLASGSSPMSYQWQFNGIDLSGQTNTTYSIYYTTPSASGTYRVLVRNDFGVTQSLEAQLTVLAPPTFSMQPVSQTLAVGETVAFSVAVVDAGPLSFQWFFNGMALSGQTNTQITLTNVGMEEGGTYFCRVRNSLSENMSSPATLTVIEAAAQFVRTPSDQVADFGDDARWEVAATGATPLQYQWCFNGQPLAGAIASSLLITKVDWSNAGTYQVVVSTPYHSITSPPAMLTLRRAPNVAVWGTNELAKAIPSDLTNAVSVSASEHVLALREDGTVAAWGLNTYGQATVPAGLSNVVAVAAGWMHSLALRRDGQVVAWGRNLYDLTNVPPDLTNVVAIAAGSLHNLAVRGDGIVSAWGYNPSGLLSPPTGLSNVVGVAANSEASLALKKDGMLVRWGNGYFVPEGLSNVVRVMGRARRYRHHVR